MMTIKGVQNGKAIPMSAEESLPKAVVTLCSKGQTDEFIFWAKEETIKLDEFSVQDSDKPGSWVAKAKGTVSIGKTRKSTDQFFEPKAYNFVLTYRNGVDNLGLPTIKIDSGEFFQDKAVDVGAPHPSDV